MSDFTTRPAAKATEDQDGSSSDEGGSYLRSDAARQPPSFWGRAARMLFPSAGANLRENLTDALAEDSDQSGEAFSREERDMLRNILHFREMRVADVMVPRANIQAVDETLTIGELMNVFEESGRSRMPVYRGKLDDPRGMVHIRDLLSYLTREARLKAGHTPPSGIDLGCVDLSRTIADAGIMRSVLFVPPSMQAADLLVRMRSARTQMALVIDEYGGTDGLVSHEDIVELVVGDIEDEHDDEEALFARVSEDSVVADGRAELEGIAKMIGPDFDIRDQLEDVDTLAGLIFSALSRIPARGETVLVEALPAFEFHILDSDNRRIKRVRISRKPAVLPRQVSPEDSRREKAGELRVVSTAALAHDE